MEELNAGFGKLGLNSGGFEGDGLQNDTQDQIPFQPSGDLTVKLGNSPRYLFRVFSEASAGENTNEWVKSPDAMKGILVDIFARDDPLKVAITLNEHLWWRRLRSHGDPFISWTTSLLFAIQYAIYKHKTEHTELQTIQLCIVDTTKFPHGVFLRDLDLIEEFKDKGLGVYYFGEYLSQGQTKIRGRSCTVSCDNIINDNLFTLLPSLRNELEETIPKWAKSVLKFREPFYCPANSSTKRAETAHLTAAITIALGFEPNWILPIFANLLALSPRRAQDQGIIGVVIYGFSSVEKRLLLSQETKVVADHTIPEVLQFGKLMRDIKEGAQTPHQPQRIFKWLGEMDQTHLSPLVQALGRLIDVME